MRIYLQVKNYSLDKGYKNRLFVITNKKTRIIYSAFERDLKWFENSEGMPTFDKQLTIIRIGDR